MNQQQLQQEFYRDAKVVLFPMRNKTGNKPDFTGKVQRDKKDIASLIIYENAKDLQKLSGYFVLIEDYSVRVTIEQTRNETDNILAPNFKGTILIGSERHEWALWVRTDKNKNVYYAGKIGKIIVAK